MRSVSTIAKSLLLAAAVVMLCAICPADASAANRVRISSGRFSRNTVVVQNGGFCGNSVVVQNRGFGRRSNVTVLGGGCGAGSASVLIVK